MYCKQQVALESSKKNDWSMTKLHERESLIERGKYSTTNSDAARCHKPRLLIVMETKNVEGSYLEAIIV